MNKTFQNSLVQSEIIFGDALFRLYRFGKVEGVVEKASRVPILHDHPFWEVMLCAEASYEVVFESESLSLSPHTAFLMPESLAHCVKRAEGSFPLSFGISVERTGGDAFIYKDVSARLKEKEKSVFTPSAETEMLFYEWYGAESKTIDAFCKSQVIAARFLYSFLKDISAFGDENVKSATDRKASIDALLNTMLDDRRYSLKEIAEALGYTRKHTLRLIHSKYDCDYRTLKKRKAIEAAELYLLSPQKMTVKEIAAALGYESESAFYAFFKREKGISPIEYRKEKLILNKKV